MTRLFLDANVLFTAAHNPEGKAALVIELAAAGHWEGVTNAYCVAEARLNLERKFPEFLARLEKILDTIRLVPDVRAELCPIRLPEKDRPVFASAVRCGATRSLTGDRRHFGPLMNKPGKTAGVVVQTVGDFLSKIES
ncbi:MAG: hypothetical protein WBX50_06185 [Candidatus Deferrimicrobiaceae bacterium]